LESYSKEATDAAKNAEQVTTNFLNNAEDAFVNFTETGKFEWRDLLNSMISDINRALVRQNITGPLSNALNNVIKNFDFSSIFGSASALGNVFSHGQQLRTYASGGIVTRPTIFPMANGAGLMGEAGPEAIMPLRRVPSGRLGVESAGNSGPLYMVNVDARGSTDPNATAAQVQQAVDKALTARIPGIIRASSTTAKAEIIDSFQRRGGRLD
jgi:lambda family phage tail tape measure protein